MARLTVDTQLQGSSTADQFIGEETSDILASVVVGVDIFDGAAIIALSGNDRVDGRGVASGDSSEFGSVGSDGIGIRNSGSVSLGKGEDEINGVGTGGDDFDGGNATGLHNFMGIIHGNRDNDLMMGTAQAGSGLGGGSAIGINNELGSIMGGLGNDQVLGVAIGGSGQGGGSGIGIENTGLIHGGQDNDLHG